MCFISGPHNLSQAFKYDLCVKGTEIGIINLDFFIEYETLANTFEYVTHPLKTALGSQNKTIY